MRFGVWSPNLANYGSAAALTELGIATEEAGWDGFFVWDRLIFDGPLADPQISLAAVAARTNRITLGPLVSAIARRRPWKYARELLALDQLAPGRVVAGLGLGMDDEFAPFSSEPQGNPARRMAMEDGYELLPQLLTGESFAWRQPHQRVGHYRSEQLTVDAPALLPKPSQQIKIWAAASIARAGMTQPTRPFLRASGTDGLFPAPIPWDPHQPLTAAELSQAINLTFGDDANLPDNYDLVVAGLPEPTDVRSFEKLGATWWLLTLPDEGTLEHAHKTIAMGPPS